MIKNGDIVSARLHNNYYIFNSENEPSIQVDGLVLAIDQYRIIIKYLIQIPREYPGFPLCKEDFIEGRYIVIPKVEDYISKNNWVTWLEEDQVKLKISAPDGLNCKKCKEFIQYAEYDENGIFVCHQCKQYPYRFSI